MAERIVGKSPTLLAVNEPAVSQEREMPGHVRLRQACQRDEFGDAARTVPQGFENGQPRWIARKSLAFISNAALPSMLMLLLLVL
jgi:hypothetical protein